MSITPSERERRTRPRRREFVIAVLAAAGVGAALGVSDVGLRLPGAARNDGAVLILPDVFPSVVGLDEDPLGSPAVAAYKSPNVEDGANGIPLVVGRDGEVRAVRDVGGVFGRNMALSPDGTLLALVPPWELSSDDSPTIRVVDVRTGNGRTFIAESDGMGGALGEPVWSPDGKRLVANATVTTFRAGERVRTRELPLTLDVEAGRWQTRTHPAPLAFSPDGQREVRRARDHPDEHTLVVAEVDGPHVAVVQPSYVHDAVFSPAGDRIATISSAAQPIVQIFDASTGERLATKLLNAQYGTSLLGWGRAGILVHLQQDRDWRSWVELVDPDSRRRGERVIEAEQGLDVWPVRLPHGDVDAYPR